MRLDVSPAVEQIPEEKADRCNVPYHPGCGNSAPRDGPSFKCLADSTFKERLECGAI
jgi:hypothetical protein